MPNRIVRESILRSRKVNQLSWGAECFYRRLINVVDDYGLYYADTGILRRDLYPRTDSLTSAQVGKWARECVDAKLLTLYGHDGDFYLVMHGVDAPRAQKSKYPMPSANICKQMIPDASKCPVVVVVNESVNVKQPSSSGDDGFDKFYAPYPRKVGRGAAEKAWKKLSKEHRLEAIDYAEAFGEAWERYDPHRDRRTKCPHASTWLNDKRWTDDPLDWVRMAKGE